MHARRTRTLVFGVLVLALGAVFLVTRGPAEPTPSPPGTFSFAVLGDAPYYSWEEIQYRLVLQALNAHDLRWVLHVGDIFWRPCTDEMYRRSLERFNGLRHPVIYTPGDNEWTDCWERGSGGFPPLDRLERIRQIFFKDPTRSLGGSPLSLVSQSGHKQFRESSSTGAGPTGESSLPRYLVGSQERSGALCRTLRRRRRGGAEEDGGGGGVGA